MSSKGFPIPNKTPSEAIANTTEDLGARKKAEHRWCRASKRRNADVDLPQLCSSNNSRAAPSRASDSKTGEKKRQERTRVLGFLPPGLGFRAVL